MAVSMMKDEAPFLIEWVAHHLAIGFTDVLVYTNDCTDGTVEMLERLQSLGLAHHRPNVIPPGIKPQPSAIAHAQAEPLVADADWVMLLDADEFLCINHPSGNVEGMLDDAVARGANGIVVTWRILGSNGVTDWSRAPVTEQYTRAAPPDWNKGWGVKTLFRFDPEFWKLGIHRPSIRNKHLEDGFPDTVHWLNGSGEPMEDYFKFRGWRSIRRTIGYDWAQVNHYAVKSVESYMVRRFRGNVNAKKDKYNADYWALQDRNEVEDRSALRHAARRAEIAAALLDDPVLRDLHEAAQERIEAWLADHRRTDPYRETRDALKAASAVPIDAVEAKPPKARDPARIAERMSLVERKAAARPKSERRRAPAVDAGWDADPYHLDAALSGAADWVANHDILLPADRGLFRTPALAAVSKGRFERRQARGIAGALDGTRSLLDLGTGIGFVAMRALRLLPGLSVLAHDRRAGLAEAALEIATRNGIGARFKVAGPDEDLTALLLRARPDGLRIGDAGQVTPEALATADLSCVLRVVLPARDAADTDAMRDRYGRALAALAFAETPTPVGGALLFTRKCAS
jgi:hypothetical protein